jgi:hypothetical protein
MLSMYATCAPWRLPVIRAVLDGHLYYAEVACGIGRQYTKAAVKHLGGVKRPTLASVADDDEMSCTGPSGFSAVSKLIDWANRVILYSTGEDAAFYRLAVAAAIQFRRVLLIETTTALEGAWLRIIPMQSQCCELQFRMVPNRTRRRRVSYSDPSQQPLPGHPRRSAMDLVQLLAKGQRALGRSPL